MVKIEDYIKLTREERQKHLELSEQCCYRGGISTHFKGILAQYLGTTIPGGRILLCHACNNKDCSNPRHLYWGTDYENIVIDGKEFGTHKNPWERVVEKYGLEEAKRRNARGNKSAGGKANKGKVKSDEHRKKISEAIKEKYLRNKNTCSYRVGRKAAMDTTVLINNVVDYGFKEAANKLGLTYEQCRGRYYRYIKNIKK